MISSIIVIGATFLVMGLINRFGSQKIHLHFISNNVLPSLYSVAQFVTSSELKRHLKAKLS